MALVDKIRAAIKAEFRDDPHGRGYAGKTLSEKLDLLNSSFTITETISFEKEMAPRITEILAGIAHAPNALDLQDLQDAING